MREEELMAAVCRVGSAVLVLRRFHNKGEAARMKMQDGRRSNGTMQMSEWRGVRAMEGRRGEARGGRKKKEEERKAAKPQRRKRSPSVPSPHRADGKTAVVMLVAALLLLLLLLLLLFQHQCR